MPSKNTYTYDNCKNRCDTIIKICWYHENDQPRNKEGSTVDKSLSAPVRVHSSVSVTSGGPEIHVLWPPNFNFFAWTVELFRYSTTTIMILLIIILIIRCIKLNIYTQITYVHKTEQSFFFYYDDTNQSRFNDNIRCRENISLALLLIM